MNIIIKKMTKEQINDVVDFEKALRKEEDFWNWDINDKYIQSVTKSFEDERFSSSITLLAYMDNRVVGRIDSTIIASHFDGEIKAYLDWICVLKSYRHLKVAQTLLDNLRLNLNKQNIHTLIGIIATNEEAQRFYKSIRDSKISDKGIWIDC